MTKLYPVRGLTETSEAFRAELCAVAKRLGLDPTDLAAVMAFETAGTFSPAIRNPQSGATGLIQWMPATARAFGTSVEALARMTAVEQLAWVEKYFARYRNRALTLHELYMVVFWGSPVGESTVLALRDEPGRSGAVYRQNKNLDQNHDGRIVAGEASLQVRAIAAAARRLPPLPLSSEPEAGDSSLLPAPSVCTSGRGYVVRVGDTLYLIALAYTKNGARWRELLASNPGLTTTIYPGQTIQLPAHWVQS